MDILSITNKSSVSADAKIYTKDGSDFVTTTFDALYNKSSAKTNIEKSVSDANARIDTTNNAVAELDNYARTKANGIVLQSQGEMVTVNDSSDDYAVNLKPYGKSEQDSTTGAQLFDKSNVTTGYELNSTDGSVSENSGYYVSDFIEVVENESYYLYKHTEASDTSNCFYDENKNFLSTITKNYGELLVPSGAKYLRFNGSVIGIDGVMLNAGSTALPWEPYTGGQPSPSPQYPQEIRSTVISEVRSCGKNELKNTATSQTVNGVTFTVNDDGSVTVNGTATLVTQCKIGLFNIVAQEQYAVSGCPSGGADNGYRIDLRSDATGVIIASIDKGDGATFSYSSDAEVYCVIRIESGATVSNLTFYPMIRKADIEDKTYEPYTETVATLSKPITLNAIPTDSGGNFTDSNGQQWIADYIDVAKGNVVRKVYKYEFTGTERFSQGTSEVIFTLSTKGLPRATKEWGEIMCTHCVISSTYQEYVSFVATARVGYNGQLIYFKGFGTPEEIVAFLTEQYANGTTLTIYYELATPTEEDLPTEDIVALRGLKTFYSVTNVTNNSEVKGEMVLLYNADTKMYIDNKFAELAAQLV